MIGGDHLDRVKRTGFPLAHGDHASVQARAERIAQGGRDRPGGLARTQHDHAGIALQRVAVPGYFNAVWVTRNQARGGRPGIGRSDAPERQLQGEFAPRLRGAVDRGVGGGKAQASAPEPARESSAEPS